MPLNGGGQLQFSCEPPGIPAQRAQGIGRNIDRHRHDVGFHLSHGTTIGSPSRKK
jgi:hypothetical protein